MLNIIENRLKYFIFSWIIILLSLWVLFFGKLNLWIDMTWWTQSEYSFDWDINLEEINKNIEDLSLSFNENNDNIINSTSAYRITWEDKIGVVIWFDSHLDEKTLEKVKTTFKDEVTKVLENSNNTFVLNNYTNIWKSFWDYIQKTAKVTLILALVSISVYIMFAFNQVVNGISSYVFAFVTWVTLFHDVIISIWLYVFTSMYFPEFKLDTYTVTALLTILWYSINDTIVVFDRIRANLRQFWGRNKSLKDIVEISLKETITRSLFTSLTVVFVLIAIFFVGPESLKWFILIMIYGTIFGTYSSIFIASPMLYALTKNNKIEVYKKVIVKDEDKIVV